MRFSSFVPFALAVAPSFVSAAGNLGFSLGVKKTDGNCKAEQDFQADFDALVPHGSIVRTYSASDCNNAQPLVRAAKAKNFRVVFGIWADAEQSFNADMEALKTAVPGNEKTIAAITVGSETLYRGSFNGQQLLEKINVVRQAFPGVQVGTADSWNKYADGTADPLIEGGVEYFLVNAFAFWQGQEINNATATYVDDMKQAIDHIQSVAQQKGKDSKKFYIATGETGWPTDGGSNYGAAQAGTQNAQSFHDKGVCTMLKWGVDVFFFEAFDEPWKPNTSGDNGQSADEKHWGMFTADRQTKYKVQC